MKKCSSCNEEKDNASFYSGKGECKKCFINKRKGWMKEVGSSYWWQRRYQKSKQRARTRGIGYELTFDEYKKLMEAGVCFYCENAGKKITIDRISNAGAYSKENCVSSCMDCNRKKLRIDIDDAVFLKNLVRVMKVAA